MAPSKPLSARALLELRIELEFLKRSTVPMDGVSPRMVARAWENALKLVEGPKPATRKPT